MSGGLYSMNSQEFDKTLDLTSVKPYGDTMNDGKVQLSFTLPVPAGAEATEAAKLLIKKIPKSHSTKNNENIGKPRYISIDNQTKINKLLE